MTRLKKHSWCNITLRAIQVKLRRLPDVDVPETLMPKLLADIPHAEPVSASKPQAKWLRDPWDIGATAAAAVLILALMFVVNYGMSNPSWPLLAEYDTSLSCTTWEQTNVLYDQNNALRDRISTYMKDWLPVNQNEPWY